MQSYRYGLGAGSVRNRAVAADIDARGLEAAVRLLHRIGMLMPAPGLSSLLSPTS